MVNNQQQIGAAGNTKLDFLAVMRLLLSKIYLLIIAGIIMAALVLIVLRLFVAPTYESSVSFYVYNSSDAAAHTGIINNNDLQAAESLATTYSKILSSNSVLDAVLDQLEEKDITRKELGKMVKASVVTDTQLLEVVVTTTDPVFSREVASAFAAVAPTEIIRITKAGGVEVVDQPEIPDEKSSPKTTFDMIIGFLIGAVAMSVILVSRMLSDSTIYLPEDLDQIGGVTVLGQIPEIRITEESVNLWKIAEESVSVNEAEKK